MALLNFTIHAFRRDEPLRHLVESCGIYVNDWTMQYDSSEHTDSAELRRSLLVIHCSGKSQRSIPFDAYCNLQCNWIRITNALKLTPDYCRPQLLFLDNRAFARCSEAYHENVNVSSLVLGTLAWPSQFYMHYESSAILNFHHDTKQLDMKFPLQILATHVGYPLLRLHYSNIREIYVTDSSTSMDIYLMLINPPLLYSVETKVFGRHTGEFETRALNMPHVSTDVLGKSNALKISGLHRMIAEEIISRLHFRCGKIPVYHVAMMTTALKIVDQLPGPFFLYDFHCSYLLEAILRRNFIVQIQNVNRWNEFCFSLKKHAAENTRIMQKTLTKLLYYIDDGLIVDFTSDVEMLFARFQQLSLSGENKEDQYIVPAKTRMVVRVVSTPTRLILWPPELMLENRILRNFDSDFALRISFRDDNFRKLSLQANYTEEAVISNAVRVPLLQGITIGQRHFEFLAWSNSQVRDHGVWMYAIDKKGNDSAAIRSWMGDFSQIRNVSKYMSRMGQCFSQTNNTFSIPVENTRTVGDVMGGVSLAGKPYCFSDGIGKISKSLSQEVCNILGKKRPCSAFQIRYGGCKGMLAIDPTLKDVEIVFRKSMQKFPCPQSKMLEIVKTSAPAPIFLNRQLITILDHHGVAKEVFLSLQEKMLRTLTDMLLDEKQAGNYLQAQSILNAVDFCNLYQSGISLTTEVFFRNMLLALHRRDIDGIKSKARLAIDPTLGRNMFGILDETGLLQYGQVFIQYTKDIEKKGNREAVVLKGRVLVTKNPCMQPGDVRMLNAVDVPQLHHLKDCIVFPQKGARPHPDEMAGSDLDGDEYTVIWQKQLFFAQNVPAEHFPSPPEKLVVGPIQLRDMVDFLCQYIQNDQLGLLCNSHLAFANIKGLNSNSSLIFANTKGLNSAICINLARKARIAVDFAKTGVEVKIDKNERPEKYPDFMEKGLMPSFKSRTALGVLYRVSRDFVLKNQFASMFYNNVHCDPDLLYPGWEQFKESATRSLTCYNRLLQEILSTYGVVNESEAMTKAFSKLHSRLQERKDRAEVETMITSSVQTLWKNMRREFWNEFVKGDLPQEAADLESEEEDVGNFDAIDVLKKASAWYAVTYSQKNAKFLSFPWIVAKQLATMKVQRLTMRNSWPPPEKPLIAQMNNTILNSSVSKTALTFNEIKLIEKSDINIPVETLILGARIVKFWVQKVRDSYQKTNIQVDILTQLFLFATSKKPHAAKTTPMDLFIEFLRYCLSLRFLSKEEVQKIVPFMTKSHKFLCKMCIVSYHNIAIDGNLSCLRISSEPINEEIEMEPQQISEVEVKSKGQEKLKADLKNETGVRVVYLRRQRRNWLVTAHGSLESVRCLRKLLQKDSAFLFL